MPTPQEPIISSFPIEFVGSRNGDISRTGTARVRLNSASGVLEISENGGAYRAFIGHAGNEVLQADLAAAVSALMQGTPTITVGTEAGNAIVVMVQLKDAAGTNLAAKHVVYAWLSDTAGAAISATAPNGTVAISTAGVIVKENTTKKEWKIITSAAGVFDLSIGESGTPTFFLNIEYQGKVYSSAAITFA